MKYTLCITQECSLRCQYCYVFKKNISMPLRVAERIIDFLFRCTPPEEKIEINFSGGEPLLEFELMKRIIEMIENHPSSRMEKTSFSVTTNGTIFPDEIARFLIDHHIEFCLSCDGPPFVHDIFRCFQDGRGSSSFVEQTLRQAKDLFPSMRVNAVYHPSTFRYLPRVVEYFTSLDIKHIFLNPDFSAPWTKRDANLLPGIYAQIADQYISYSLQQKAHFISLIDSKIALIMQGGYKAAEQCRIGKTGFAFTPSGNIYPCEKLIGSDSGEDHCIGNINDGIQMERISVKTTPYFNTNNKCIFCDLKNYCMNWCGCSNYFSSGYYNRVGPFLCASEKTAIKTALNVYQTLEKKTGVPLFSMSRSIL